MLTRKVSNDNINVEVKNNELKANDWELWELAHELYWWVDFFNMAFFKDQPVPLPLLTFESSRVNTLGHYRIGRNDFGAKEQINLNRKYLHLPLWSQLSTLLHEMVHSWEYTYLDESKRTKNWYHTKSFRAKLADFGILSNEKGQHLGIDRSGDFYFFLKKHGVRFDLMPEGTEKAKDGSVKIDPDKGKKKGKSKLKKWSCGCTNVRVAVSIFDATCNRCGNKFEQC